MNKLIELYDIISKDIVIMNDNIKQAKKDCNYEDILTYCAGKMYAHKVIQEINKLIGDDTYIRKVSPEDEQSGQLARADIINKLTKHINEELQFLESKIQWLQECGDQTGATYLEGKESAYKQIISIVNIINRKDSE